MSFFIFSLVMFILPVDSQAQDYPAEIQKKIVCLRNDRQQAEPFEKYLRKDKAGR
jgi:hypothetical protein